MNFNKLVELEDIALFSTNKTTVDDIDEENYISTENLIPNYGGKSIASGLPNQKKVTSYEKGDVLISNIRPYFKKIWRATYSGGSSNDVLVVRPKSIVDEGYLYYSLANDNFFDYVMSGAKGTKMPRGDKNHILRYKIGLPEKKEQKAIAKMLLVLDKKIETNNQINKTLENMAQAIFTNWFVDFEFPNEDGEPYKSSGGEMVESELGMIPKGWEVGKIEDLGKVVGGGTPSKKREEFFTENGIPWITPKDLSNNKDKFIMHGALDITEEGLKGSSAKLMPKGTVLFSSRAPIGYIAVADKEVSTNQGFKSIIPKSEYGTEFTYQVLKNKTEMIISRASGSTFKEISGSGLKSIELVLPKRVVVHEFNEIAGSLSKKIKVCEAEIRNLIKLRDTLLPKLMSGEIRVPIEE